MKRALALGLLAAGLCATACRREPAQTNATGEAPPPPPTRAVVTQHIQACQALEQPAAPEVPDDIGEHVDGLLSTLAYDHGRLRPLALEELTDLGEAAVATLDARLLDGELDQPLRLAAAEGLAQIGAAGSRAAAEALLACVQSSPTVANKEFWLYQRCALELGRVKQPWVIVRMLQCLKYEVDYDTVLSLVDGVARYGNLGGLEAVFVIERNGAPEVQARAQALVARLVAEFGARDAADLERRWYEGDASLPPPPDDPAYVCEIWRNIDGMKGWELLPVDMARYGLSRCGAVAAAQLAEALSDENLYVRLHSAQTLERMGPRGRVAGPALLSTLDDPQVGPEAALALGSVRYEPAAAELTRRAAGSPSFELQVASVRALGRLAPADLAATMAPCLAEDQPLDLRAAAAGALLTADPGDAKPAVVAAPARLMASLLVSKAIETRTIEDTLGSWLGRRSDAGDAWAAATLEAWLGVPLQPDEARLEARSKLLTERLSAFGA